MAVEQIVDDAEVRDVRRNLHGGSVAALLRIVLAVPVYLLLTPFTLKYLGVEQFAIWSFNATVIGIVNLADLGFKSSLLFNCAQCRGDEGRLIKLFGTSLCIYLCVWMLLMIACVVALDDIVRLLNVPLMLQSSAGFVVLMTVVSFGLRFMAMPFQAVIEAHHGVAFSQYVLLGWLVMNAALTFLIVPWCPSVYAMGGISLASNAFVLASFAWRLRNQFPFLKLTGLLFVKDIAHSLFKYGSGVYIATLMITLREPLYKVFLSRTFGLAEVANFEICFRLCTQVVSAVISPLLGVFAAAAVLAHRPKDMIAVLRPLWGFTIVAFLPLTLGIFCFAPVMVRIWLGPNSAGVAALLPWVFCAFALYYVSEVIYQALLGSGASSYGAVVQTAVVGTCAVMLYLLRFASAEHAIEGSILTGFATFTLFNSFKFKRRFPRQALFSQRPMLWLLLPSLAFGYLACWVFSATDTRAVMFVIYLGAHIWVAHRVEVVNVTTLAQRFVPRFSS